MARSTAEAFNMVCCLDRSGKLDDSPQNKKQKAATALLRDKLHEQDFAGPLSSRTSKNSWNDQSVSHCGNSASHETCVARRSFWTHCWFFFFLRILCNGLHTAQRFHTEGEEQLCRVGCPDAPDSLPHYNECPLLYNLFSSIWEHATALPRRGHLLHDLITRVFLLSLQYGIVVVGLTDAFVYAHDHHRRNIENPGNLGDCMKGRIPFMTAVTPAHAHAYQATCLTRHIPAVQNQRFRLPSAKARYPHLSNIGSKTCE